MTGPTGPTGPSGIRASLLGRLRGRDGRWMSVKIGSAAVLLAVLAAEAIVVTRSLTPADDPSASRSSAEIVRAPAPQPPDGLPTDGAYVVSTVRPDGSVEVSHWIRSPRPLDRVTLRVPQSVQAPGPSAALDLAVSTDRGRVSGGGSLVGPAPATVDLVRPARLVHLTYRLIGVTSRAPDPPGRALAAVTSLEADWDDDAADVRVVVSAPAVLNLACTPPSGTDEQRACGAQGDQGWSVDLQGVRAQDQVSAQVDLDEEPDE